MSLIDGHLAAGPFLETRDGSRIPLHRYAFLAPPEPGRAVRLGIRPEDVTSPSEIPAECQFPLSLEPGLIETTGADTHASFAWTAGEITGRFRPDAIEAGRPVAMAMDMRKLSVFDAVTGQRL
jgi:ABC-type sugar transport system ATPase subunit